MILTFTLKVKFIVNSNLEAQDPTEGKVNIRETLKIIDYELILWFELELAFCLLGLLAQCKFSMLFAIDTIHFIGIKAKRKQTN